MIAQVPVPGSLWQGGLGHCGQHLYNKQSPGNRKKAGQQWRQHQFHFLLVSQLVKSLGRHRVKKLFRWRRDSAIIQETFPAQNGWHLIIASRIIRCVSFSYYKLRMGRTLATLCVCRSIDQKSLLPERNQIWQQETCLVIRNCDIPIREGVRKTFVRT